MPAPSLFHLAQKKAMKNIRAIPDIGLVPYNLIRPILAKIDKPEHLHNLELKSPHIQEDDAELWIEFIKRDVPQYDHEKLPTTPDSWYDVYCELVEQAERELDKDAQKMKSALEGISSDRAKNTARVVDTHTLRHLPKERPTLKQKYASHDRRMGGLAPIFVSPSDRDSGGGFGSIDAPAWTFETPRIPRSGGGKSSSGLFATKRKKALAVPTHRLISRATPVRQAPRAFLEDHKLAQIPTRVTRPVAPRVSGTAGSRVIAPGRQKVQNNPATPASGPSLQEREARLRALTSSQAKKTYTPPSPVSSSKTKSQTQTASSSPPSLPGKRKILPGSTASSPPPIIKTKPSPLSANLPSNPLITPRTIVSRPITKTALGKPGTPVSPPKTNPTNITSNAPTAPTVSPKSTASTPSERNGMAPAPIIRKRPPPAVFIQPKKRKVA